jgi:RNA polymerase sigma factor (sigma-70 family)
MQSQITQEDFDHLLAWLDFDREAAGVKYEKIRGRLSRLFAARGFYDAEDLADETINRVIKKIQWLKANYTGDPNLYFYGAAKRVAQEAQRRKDKRPVELPLSPGDANETEVRMRLLDECLMELSADDQHLLFSYYADDGAVKINNRKQLVHSLRLSPAALRQRAHRLKAKMKTAVLERLREEGDSF